jgi:hypothetical protein
MPNNLTEAQLENEELLYSIKHGGSEGMEKVANTIEQEMIFKFLREDGFSRNIVEYKQVTRDDLQQDPYHPDILTKFIPVEDPIHGYLVTSSDWMQSSKEIWYTSKLYRLRFNPLVSRTFKMSENQIINAQIPIRQYIEGVIRNDFLATEDTRFMEQVESCIAMTGNVLNSPNTFMQPGDIGLLKSMFDDNRVPLTTILCHESVFTGVFNWTTAMVGSIVMEQIVNGGINTPDGKYRSFFGYKWITTLNSDIVPKGFLYGFTDQKMLGAFYEFGSPETTIKWENYILSIKMREVIAQAIVVPNGVAKIDFS